MAVEALPRLRVIREDAQQGLDEQWRGQDEQRHRPNVGEGRAPAGHTEATFQQDEDALKEEEERPQVARAERVA